MTAITVIGLAGCATAPFSAEEAAASDTFRLCRMSGWTYAAGDARGFQAATNELRARNAMTDDCIAIAQVEMTNYARHQQSNAAMAQALGNMAHGLERQPVNMPAPVNCNTVQTSDTTSRTRCQ